MQATPPDTNILNTTSQDNLVECLIRILFEMIEEGVKARQLERYRDQDQETVKTKPFIP